MHGVKNDKGAQVDRMSEKDNGDGTSSQKECFYVTFGRDTHISPDADVITLIVQK